MQLYVNDNEKGYSMLKLCIIDDEHLALQYLNFMLNKIEGVRVKGIYSNPKHLIDYAENHHIDVVFMDVQMPGISGFDLAEQLLKIQPSLHIVFVTAYEKNAVENFKAKALDYILKPIQEKNLSLLINQIKEKTL